MDATEIRTGKLLRVTEIQLTTAVITHNYVHRPGQPCILFCCLRNDNALLHSTRSTFVAQRLAFAVAKKRKKLDKYIKVTLKDTRSLKGGHGS